jgi:integrase
MKKSTGFVRKRDGRWLARITWTNPETGRRAEKREIVASAAAGHDRVAEWRRELQEYGSISSPRASGANPNVKTFADLADFYEGRYVVPPTYNDNRKVAGMRAWKTARGHVALLRRLMGQIPLAKISWTQLSDLRDDLLKSKTKYGRTVSIAYVQRILSTCRRMLHVARQRGWMVHNPFDQGDSLINPAYETERQRILTPGEEEALLAQCTWEQKRAHLRTMIILALETGMRQGEILRLRRQDIDLDRRLIHVQAMHTKTLEARIVPITDRLFGELQEYLVAVPDSWPTVFDVTTVDTAFRGAKTDAGLKDLRFHDLRHTAATRMIEAGVPEALVGRMLGHKVAQTTRRYINLHEQAAMQIAALLDRRAVGIKPLAGGSVLVAIPSSAPPAVRPTD